MRSSRPPHGNTSSGGPFDTLVGLFDRSRDRHASAPLLGEKRDGQWHWITYREVGERVDAFRGGLKAAGVTAGDRVALISDNRIEWAVTAYACFGLGAALVPMYEAQSTDDWAFITKDCGAKMLVCANQSIFDRCAGLTSDIDGVKQRIGLELPASQPNAYARLLAKGRDEPTESIELDPNDTACIMYTSGTTGAPKGVVLSHRNICSNVHALVDAIPLSSADRSLSLLPWAHAFGQTCELHTMIALGASMALAESNARVRANLEEVKPTVLVSVPRIFNRIYAIVNRQMNLRPALTRSTFETAMQLKRAQRERELTLPERVAVEAADRLVLSTVRARFGGRLRCAFSGGAALDNEVAEFMEDLGITVYDGYGLTEASSVVSINTPEARRIGSVGKPLAGVRIEVDTAESDHPDDGTGNVCGRETPHGTDFIYCTRLLGLQTAQTTRDLLGTTVCALIFVTTHPLLTASGKVLAPLKLDKLAAIHGLSPEI